VVRAALIAAVAVLAFAGGFALRTSRADTSEAPRVPVVRVLGGERAVVPLRLTTLDLGTLRRPPPPPPSLPPLPPPPSPVAAPGIAPALQPSAPVEAPSPTLGSGGVEAPAPAQTFFDLEG
jgi:hypothetical protein